MWLDASLLRKIVVNLLSDAVKYSGDNSTLIQLSCNDKAALIGTAPESLRRTLSEFRQDGIIELTNKFTWVQQPEKLRRTNW